MQIHAPGHTRGGKIRIRGFASVFVWAHRLVHIPSKGRRAARTTGHQESYEHEAAQFSPLAARCQDCLETSIVSGRFHPSHRHTEDAAIWNEPGIRHTEPRNERTADPWQERCGVTTHPDNPAIHADLLRVVSSNTSLKAPLGTCPYHIRSSRCLKGGSLPWTVHNGPDFFIKDRAPFEVLNIS